MEKKLHCSKRSITIFDDTTGVLQVVTQNPPEHCILKIDSFSVLQDALSGPNKDHINSTQFNVGGCKWVLSVYPNGNAKEGGAGHLSFYVTLIRENVFCPIVDASARFFIYDHIQDNYVTFQYVGNKKFFDSKTAWGIRKVLSLDYFSDASNGFLVKDCCTFGAEVHVVNFQLTRSRSLVSLVKSDCDRNYSWKIKNFSALNNDGLFSPLFSFGEWSWKLLMYPRGNGEATGKHLSLFLGLDNADGLTHGKNLYAKVCLCIRNQDGNRTHHNKKGRYWFSSEWTRWGYRSFISISDLYDVAKGFLVDDTLSVEVRIQMMLLLKDIKPINKKFNKCV